MAALRALLVEDNALIVFGLEPEIEERGMAIAGSASTLAKDMHRTETVDCDIAILDVNMHNPMVFPVANILIGRGIPVILTSGYELEGELPACFANVLRVSTRCKPETLLQGPGIKSRNAQAPSSIGTRALN